MPLFRPPTVNQSSSDSFWGRYSIPVGQSVVKRDGTYQLTPFPWLGEITDLKEGVDYFLGGHEYVVSTDIASDLTADGFTVE